MFVVNAQISKFLFYFEQKRKKNKQPKTYTEEDINVKNIFLCRNDKRKENVRWGQGQVERIDLVYRIEEIDCKSREKLKMLGYRGERK